MPGLATAVVPAAALKASEETVHMMARYWLAVLVEHNQLVELLGQATPTTELLAQPY